MDQVYNLNYYLNMLNESYRYTLSKLLLNEAKQFGVDIEKDICYLKNLFLEDEAPILFVFTAEKVLAFSVDNEKESNITVKICNKIDLKNISYIHAYYDSEYQVKFFMNDEEIVLIPEKDTNTHHASSFNDNLKHIIEYLKTV